MSQRKQAKGAFASTGLSLSLYFLVSKVVMVVVEEEVDVGECLCVCGS